MLKWVFSRSRLCSHAFMWAIALGWWGMTVACAETVGRINFVKGEVIVAAPDGQVRKVHKNDLLLQGDRVTTRDGWVQIRFRDGGYMALQPYTVLGVEAYSYSTALDARPSLLFQLVRGGLRASTGVIGQGRHSDYQVKTPVADIHVRGSAYTAAYEGKVLHVAAGTGRVFVTNDDGSMTLLSGQSAEVQPDAGPMPTDDMPSIEAPGPDDHAGILPGVAALGDRVGEAGLPLGIQPLPILQNSVNGTPRYNLIMPGINLTASGSGGGNRWVYNNIDNVEQNLSATFDSHNGALLMAATPTQVVLDNTGSVNPLNDRGIITQTSISFGEMTGGSSQQGDIHAANGQYLPYLIGMAGSAPAQAGSVSYSLALPTDATPSRLYDSETGVTSSGNLKQLTLTLNLTQLQLTADLQLQLTGGQGSAGVTGSYEAKANNVGVPALLQNGVFVLSGLTTTGPSGGICGTTCTTTLSGFFAGTDGSRLGTSYDISTTAGEILGVAALSQSSPVGIASSAPLSNATQPIYSFVMPSGTPSFSGDTSNYVFSGLQGSFASASSASTAPAAGALLTLAASGNTSATLLDNLGSTPLQYNALTTLGAISYAELSNGSGTLPVNGTSPSGTAVTLNNSSYRPYLVGVSGTLPDVNLGTVSYSLQGGTTPRLNGTQPGTLGFFNIDLNLGRLTLSPDLQLTVAGTTLQVNATNLLVASLGSTGSFMLNGLGVSGGICSKGLCSADIGGFIAGIGGSQMGTAYALEVPGYGVVTGVAALTQAPVAVAYTSSDGNTGTEIQSAVGSYGDVSGKTGMLGVAQGTSILLQRVAANTSVADESTDGTLEWGRWTSGTPTVDGHVTSAALSNIDSVHYVLGQQTPSRVLSALAAQPGIVSFALEGHGTSPTNGSAVGVLQTGTLQVNFAEETMAFALQVAMGNRTYAINDTGNLSIGSPTFNFSKLATTGTGGACAVSCSSSLSGFFAGLQAKNVGLVYAITDSGSGTVRGAAGLSR